MVSITTSSVVFFVRLKHDDSRMRAPRGKSQAQGGRFSPPFLYGDTRLHDHLHKIRVPCCASQYSGLESTCRRALCNKKAPTTRWFGSGGILSIEIAMALSAGCPVVHPSTFLRLSHPRSVEVSPHPTHPPVPAFEMCRPRIRHCHSSPRSFGVCKLTRSRVQPEHETI